MSDPPSTRTPTLKMRFVADETSSSHVAERRDSVPSVRTTSGEPAAAFASEHDVAVSSVETVVDQPTVIVPDPRREPTRRVMRVESVPPMAGSIRATSSNGVRTRFLWVAAAAVSLGLGSFATARVLFGEASRSSKASPAAESNAARAAPVANQEVQGTATPSEAPSAVTAVTPVTAAPSISASASPVPSATTSTRAKPRTKTQVPVDPDFQLLK